MEFLKAKVLRNKLLRLNLFNRGYEYRYWKRMPEAEVLRTNLSKPQPAFQKQQIWLPSLSY